MRYAAEHRTAEALRQHHYTRRSGDYASPAGDGPMESMKRKALPPVAARSIRRTRTVLVAALSAVLQRMDVTR